MGYLDETKEKLNLPALTYDEVESTIRLGHNHFRVESGLEQASPWAIVKHEDPNQLNEADVCINIHSKLIGTPRFHEWLGKVAADEDLHRHVRAQTTKVISSVFIALKPKIEDSGPFGFGMNITPNNHANLHTFGNCACLHPHPEGHWINYQEWPEGYCEYDFHNIDTHTQAWSLIAGVGYLACLAAESRV